MRRRVSSCSRAALTVVIAALLFIAACQPAFANKRCGHVRANGPWGHVHPSVRVQRGHVSCHRARHLARLLFSGRGHYHDGGYGYNSWWVVAHVWRGDAGTGAWVLNKKHSRKRIGGSY